MVLQSRLQMNLVKRKVFINQSFKITTGSKKLSGSQASKNSAVSEMWQLEIKFIHLDQKRIFLYSL